MEFGDTTNVAKRRALAGFLPYWNAYWRQWTPLEAQSFDRTSVPDEAIDEAVFTDIVTDVLHLAAEFGYSVEHLMARAMSHFTDEQNDALEAKFRDIVQELKE